MYEAGHAIRITHQVLAVTKDDITREELTLAMESPIIHIADTLDVKVNSFGTNSLNLLLSQQRADSVRSYLQANMENTSDYRMSAQGFGETKSIDNNETEDGRRRNRRIDLVIKG